MKSKSRYVEGPERDLLTRAEVIEWLRLYRDTEWEDEEEDDDHVEGVDLLDRMIDRGEFPLGICWDLDAQPVWSWLDVVAFAHLRTRGLGAGVPRFWAAARSLRDGS